MEVMLPDQNLYYLLVSDVKKAENWLLSS